MTGQELATAVANRARLEKTQDFGPAFTRARQFDGPAIVELRVDPEAITPRATLSGLRSAAMARKA